MENEAESSDNEAPEAVSFKSSKKEAVEVIKNAKEAEARVKNEKKKQRVEIEKRNVEQKKNRLLSMDVVKQADKTLKEKEGRKRRKVELDVEADAHDDGDEEYKVDEDEESDSDNDYKTPKKQQRGLVSTSFHKTTTADDVSSFKVNQFFNNRVRRMTPAERKSQKLRQSPCFN